MHTPVLLNEAFDGLKIKPGGLYIDATVGEGGYLEEILKKGGRVLAIDWDENQIKNLKIKIKDFQNITFEKGNFRELDKIAMKNGFYPVDGVVFDLGLSMWQIGNSRKGFSYKKMDEPLDMRINDDTQKTASDIINSSDENKLYEILAANSEEINSRVISKSIVRTRTLKKIEKVKDLIGAIDKSLGYKNVKTYARVFQAFRIEVNNEKENLKKGLLGALNILKPKGKIVVISFQSLEDRIVKLFIKNNNLKQVNKKVISAKGKTSFERSAKLRIIEK